MRVQKRCGILELGSIEEHDEEPGVVVRCDTGHEIFIPLEKEEVQALGKEGSLYRNLTLTITLEETTT